MDANTQIDLLPARLQPRWVGRLEQIGNSTSARDVERGYLLTLGWLEGLRDADLITAAAHPELREVLFRVERQARERSEKQG